MAKINIDGTEYDTENFSEAALDQVRNITFVNELILNKNNELQVAQTAHIGYSRSLKRELEKLDNTDVSEN